MKTFNQNFFTSNTEVTLEQATQKLIDLGYKNFTFKSLSRTNGASFYFTSENGQEIRVSDHSLTGKRAFNTIQIDLFETKVLKTKVKEIAKFELSAESIERARLRKEARLA